MLRAPFSNVLQTADNPLDYEEDVIGDVSLSDDNVVAAETNWTSLKCGKSAFQSLVGAKCFEKIYRSIYSAKSLSVPWRWVVEIDVGHCQLPEHQSQRFFACLKHRGIRFVLAFAAKNR